VVFIPVAFEIIEIGAGVGEVMVTTILEGSALAEAGAASGAILAGTEGAVGSAALTSEVVVGAGKTFALVSGASYASGLAANMTSDAQHWAQQQLDPNDRENVRKVEREAVFANFAARAGTFKCEDIFDHKYPVDPDGAILQNAVSTANQKSDGRRVSKARIIGFWAVYVKILKYDPAKLSSWRHSLDRRNFGSLAFCLADAVVQESSIHFSHQIIPIPIVRALTADHSFGELKNAVCNKIYGSLAPSVEAEISFIPVYECVGWTWSKAKAPP
jgi:hypothetical protein